MPFVKEEEEEEAFLPMLTVVALEYSQLHKKA